MDKLYASYRKWAPCKKEKGDGVVVASDSSLEWALPWWWEHYSRHNAYPVTFVDFGMSVEMKQWCQAHGHYLFLPVADIFVAEKQEVDPSLVKNWESLCGDRLWPNRNAWFKKPLACLQSPYRRSLWLDLDCEVRGSLESLFPLCEEGVGIAIAKEGYNAVTDLMTYNSGVIVFKRGLSIIETWAEHAFKDNHAFPGDQDVLSKIIYDQSLAILELPAIYNWSRCHADDAKAVILHWHGLYGKTYIYHQIQSANLRAMNLR